jgi:hypothetical protein
MNGSVRRVGNDVKRPNVLTDAVFWLLFIVALILYMTPAAKPGDA